MRKKWARSDGAAAEVFAGIAARELGVGERERGAKSGPDRWCGVGGGGDLYHLAALACVSESSENGP